MYEKIEVEVTISGIADESFPVWLNFELIDRYDHRHEFVDKAPIILATDASIPKTFPVKTHMTCALIERHAGYVVINLLNPEGIASSEGAIIFEVPLSLVKSC